MAMSKKDFIALADKIRTAPVPFMDAHISMLADFCASQNPQFNRARWMAYVNGECGPNGGAVKAGS